MNTILFVGEHPKTHDVRWHIHEHWELVYCTSGSGAFRFENGAVINYQAGDVVVIPPPERFMPIPAKKALQTSISPWRNRRFPLKPAFVCRMMTKAI